MLYGNQNVTNYGFIPTYQNGVKLEGSEPAVSSGGYQQWQQANFTAAELTNALISGDAANPAHDGLPNLLKYAMGLNPKAVVSQPFTFQFETVNSQKAPVFTYTVNSAATDVSLVLQSSTNLTTWSTATTQQISSVSTGLVNTVKLQLNPGQSLSRKLFLRLGATH